MKDPQDYIQVGEKVKVVPFSFNELLSALFSGDEAITSFKHQSHKIKK